MKTIACPVCGLETKVPICSECNEPMIVVYHDFRCEKDKRWSPIHQGLSHFERSRTNLRAILK